jgi:hypothetical protein
MKNKNEKFDGLLEGFLWSMFIGVIGISIGLGALYPPLNYIAKPFVCPAGQMTYDQQAEGRTPNQTFYSADWYCTTDSSSAGGVSINPFVSAGIIYGLLCFPVFLWVRPYFKALEKN